MAGKSGKSVDYKINLTFNTKDSDKQFQAVADRMKDQIRAIATETNKTKYYLHFYQKMIYHVWTHSWRYYICLR